MTKARRNAKSLCVFEHRGLDGEQIASRGCEISAKGAQSATKENNNGKRIGLDAGHIGIRARPGLHHDSCIRARRQAKDGDTHARQAEQGGAQHDPNVRNALHDAVAHLDFGRASRDARYLPRCVSPGCSPYVAEEA